MPIDASRVSVHETLALRELYRHELHCQIVHDSLHARGHLDAYLLRVDGRLAGYGCVGGYEETPRVTVRELYVLPAHRAARSELFAALVRASGATRLAAQTNDPLLAPVFFDRAVDIRREAILFADAFTTNLPAGGATFTRTTDADPSRVFPHTTEPVGEWMLDVAGEIAATGGVLLHYNIPYADLHMEVAPAFRRRGYGSYLVQELKRTCYEMGRVPAARCDPRNAASRATLARAGLAPCAVMLSGTLGG